MGGKGLSCLVNRHRAWWGSNQWGYVEHIADAQRYSRNEALEVCLATMPARRDQPVNDVPVRFDDMELLLRRFADVEAEPPSDP